MPRFPADFAQDPYPARLRWGRSGVLEAVRHREIVVVVDTLSFSTTSVHAIARGVQLMPVAHRPDPATSQVPPDWEMAVARDRVPDEGRYSLSPGSFAAAPAGTRVVLPSPNGATLCELAAHAPLVLVGALVNARAVAAVASRASRSTGRPVAVLAAGERAPEPDGVDGLRVALEDALGAGAILAALGLDPSFEAMAAIAGFQALSARLEAALQGTESGRELIRLGYPEDVAAAAVLDALVAVPVLRDGILVPFPVDAAEPGGNVPNP